MRWLGCSSSLSCERVLMNASPARGLPDAFSCMPRLQVSENPSIEPHALVAYFFILTWLVGLMMPNPDARDGSQCAVTCAVTVVS